MPAFKIFLHAFCSADDLAVAVCRYADSKEKPEYLQQSIESILHQTVPTDDFVLVCDGPLTPELDSVIAKYSTLHVVRLKENGGLGGALNEGMKHCQHDLIARMDSDDISRSDRCERELKVFAEHSEVDIVSGTIEEFITSPDEVYSRRVLPEKSAEIVQFAKKRKPFPALAVVCPSAIPSVLSFMNNIFRGDMLIQDTSAGSSEFLCRNILCLSLIFNETALVY